MKVVFATLLVSAAAREWDDFKAFFGKVYNGDNEDAAHKATYLFNVAVNEVQNAKGENLKFGVNQFTDLSQEEFRVAAGFGFVRSWEFESTTALLQNHVSQGETFPDSIDWEQRGAVTPVKDQGQCGSCWSFSTTGGLEGAYKVTTNHLTSMSEQQFMDCDTGVNDACNGGNVGFALTYAEGTGIATDASYPYLGVQGTCQTSFTNAIPNGGVMGHSRIGTFFKTTADDMKSALQMNPVSVAIQADQRAFQHYTSGVLSSGCGDQLDHAVLVVGYGLDGSDEYWRVKNSWAASWGDAGYIRLNTATNVCGILNSQANYPLIASSVAV